MIIDMVLSLPWHSKFSTIYQTLWDENVWEDLSRSANFWDTTNTKSLVDIITLTWQGLLRKNNIGQISFDERKGQRKELSKVGIKGTRVCGISMPTILYATAEVPCFLPRQYDCQVWAPFHSQCGPPSKAQSSGLSPHPFSPTHTDQTLWTVVYYIL